MTELEMVLLSRIAEHHRQDAITADIAPDHLTIRVGDAILVLTVQVVTRESGKDSVIVQLGFRLQLWPPEWGEVIEYHASRAQHEADALAEALHAWLDGVWPVLLALYRPDAARSLPNPVKVITVTARDEPIEWRVLVGQPLAKCQVGMLQAVEAELTRKTPFLLLGQAFADAVKQGRLRPDGKLWWGHLFASRANRQPISQEATLRGLPWPEAVDGLLQFPWPASDALMSFRQFYVIEAIGDSVTQSKSAPRNRRRSFFGSFGQRTRRS